ncbi:MAG: aminotransferase class V-fold PLP-dependent enzyme [Anaerorhabdus sp.]
MKTYPLESVSMEEAKKLQFKLVDEITKVFNGVDILNCGDVGVVSGQNKPTTTRKVETVLANFFGAEAAVLVRGAGTAAIRYALFSIIKSGETLLIHKAPVYSTTQTTLEMMGIKTVEADFNNLDDIQKVMQENSQIKAALVQITRQKSDDSYDLKSVINKIKSCGEIPIITDDNYAVMKIKEIGIQCGADLSCFSTFKLLGPEGIGCIVGNKKEIDFIIKHHYSGGSQTQGPEALEVLRGMIYAPVALSIQAEVGEEVVRRLSENEVPMVKSALLANAQSKVILIEFEEDIAEKVLSHAQKLGAAPHPVGAESKYEFVPMFYRVSGTFLDEDSTRGKRMIRVNPMRSGPDTIIRILKKSIEEVK